jgi:Kef-type K+ transport system membrane component KefB
MTEENLGLFLVQVLLLLGLARGVGEILRRLGHPPLVGEILVGLLLGPTLLGRVLPELQLALFPPDPIQQTMLDTVSWFGVLFLLLETGLEVDLSAAWRQRGPAMRVGVIGVLVPLAVGFALSMLLPERYLAAPGTRVPFALFLGTTMAISAMVIIARVLHDLDLVKSDLGLVTLCGYAVNDVLAWVILSIVLGLATPAGVSYAGVAVAVVFSVGFTAFCITLGPRLVDRAFRYVGDALPRQPGAVLTLVSCIGLACGALTHAAGLTALLGFFLAGIMAGESHALTERTRSVVSQMVHAVFVPLYFAGIGLRYDFVVEFDWFIVGFVTVISIVAKFAGAWMGTWGTALSKEDRLSVGIAFTPIGVTGIVVADIALEHGILTSSVFVGIVVSALVSSLLVAPWLMWSIDRRRAPDLLSFIVRPGPAPDLAAETPEAAIEELCARLAGAPGAPEPAACAEAVKARERVAGTATGGGLAIPHARLESLQRPLLVFGRSRAGIDWDSPDGAPVHLVFMLLSPVAENGLQLQVLAALARGLSHGAVRELLIEATSEEEGWARLREMLGGQRVERPRSQARITPSWH